MPKTHRIVPHLRWKLNERAALRELSAPGREMVAPLIALTVDQYKGGKPSTAKKPPKKKAPIAAAEVFAKQAADSWGTEAMFLDASDLSTGAPGKHLLEDISVAANDLGLQLIPATGLVASPDYRQAVERMHKADKRGVALRVSLAEMTSASTWLSSWRIPLEQTDLIVDLRDSVANVAALGQSALQSFGNLAQAKKWRSVTMAGGCIPQTLTGYKIGATPLKREELAFWRALSASGLPYRLDFGDYGSLFPDATTVSIPAPVPINAKYTLSNEFLIFHGVKIKGPGAIPMDRQLRQYARAIVAHPRRGALANCWGDTRVDEIADGSPSTGNPGSWVGYNVNRHIEVTRNDLP